MTKTEILTIAVETGFMLHTGYGQGINKQMPVSDSATLIEFANSVIEAAVLAERERLNEYYADMFEDNGRDDIAAAIRARCNHAG